MTKMKESKSSIYLSRTKKLYIERGPTSTMITIESHYDDVQLSFTIVGQDKEKRERKERKREP
jgi:hypothetical protein